MHTLSTLPSTWSAAPAHHRTALTSHGVSDKALEGAVARGPLPGPPAQPGFFDDLLGMAGPMLQEATPGLLGAASSLLSGDSGGALEQVRDTGGSALSGLAQQGLGGIGGAIGGPIGSTITSMSGAVGQGVGDVVSGESSVGEAAGGVLSSAQPALLSLLMSLLSR